MLTLTHITGDITKCKVDVIVNAANHNLVPGGGVSGAIHQAAGDGLAEECSKYDGCHTGHVIVTRGFNLSAKYILHTVAPIWRYEVEYKELLLQCFTLSLAIADRLNVTSIAFPSLGAGLHNWPIEDVVATAEEAVEAFNNSEQFQHTSLRRVFFVHFESDIH